MTTRNVDRLAQRAAEAEPPPLDDSAQRRLIERALLAPRAPETVPVRRAWLPFAVTAIAAAIVAVAWLRPTPRSSAELIHVALPTGDHLVATGAQFDVERLDRADRRLVLHSGTLLADVAHVTAGQRFAISTPHLVATARGTVFSVETDAQRSRVRVYEGIVEVTQGDDVRMLPAGTMWTSDAHAIALAPRPPALAIEIAQVITRRDREATAAAPRTPTALAIAPSAPSAAPPNAERTNGHAPTTSTVPTAPPIAEAPDVHAPVGPPSPAVVSKLDLDGLLARGRAELAAGKLDAALATAQLAATSGGTTGPWHLLAADALRGLGRPREAADAYDAAARALSGTDAIEAAYSAAYLRFKELEDYERALDGLVAARVDAADSPLEERGLALHVQILVAAKRTADARPLADQYLAHYPHGELRTLMRSLATK